LSAKKGLFKNLRDSGNHVSVVGENHEVYGSLVTEEETNLLGLRAFAAIPVKVLDEVKYVLVTDAHDRAIPIDDEAVRSMTSLANQAAMSLERMMLRAQLNTASVEG
jgi:GAF domain-containing protein